MNAMRGAASATPTENDAIRRVVELGCRAPSVHNTQPWRWRIDGSHLELRVDRSRQLRVSDPDGRNLTISCGAALHHLKVAAAALEMSASIERFPDDEDPDLVAVIDLHPGHVATPADAELLAALERRMTDRRRFTSWPVPEERLENLASVAERWGARVLPLTGTSARFTTERLVDQAIETQLRDPQLVDEQRQWIGHSAEDGLPQSSLPPQEHPSERRDRFDRGLGTARTRKPVETSDAVLAICTADDNPRAWLDAGETLSAVWLRATLAGFSVVPLSQVIEVEETREALRDEVFVGMARPQLLVRIGWQEVTREPLPQSRRRPLEDVLATPNATAARAPSDGH